MTVTYENRQYPSVEAYLSANPLDSALIERLPEVAPLDASYGPCHLCGADDACTCHVTPDVKTMLEVANRAGTNGAGLSTPTGGAR